MNSQQIEKGLPACKILDSKAESTSPLAGGLPVTASRCNRPPGVQHSVPQATAEGVGFPIF